MTEDGKKVLSGGFKLINEAGIPIEMLLDVLKSHGYVLNWEDFVTEALLADWRIKSIISKLEEATLDIYEPEQRAEFMTRLKILVAKISMRMLND
jgi:hypothetical protein